MEVEETDPLSVNPEIMLQVEHAGLVMWWSDTCQSLYALNVLILFSHAVVGHAVFKANSRRVNGRRGDLENCSFTVLGSRFVTVCASNKRFLRHFALNHFEPSLALGISLYHSMSARAIPTFDNVWRSISRRCKSSPCRSSP